MSKNIERGDAFIEQGGERYLSERYLRALGQVAFDDHHTMHQRKVHEVYPVHQSIRENPSMIAHGLARAAHNLLHLNTSPVPLLNYYTAMRVANRLPSGLFVLDGIDEFSKLVEESNKHPKIKPLEIEQNELVVKSVRAQIPYIRDGYPSGRIVA